jgi:hypothetical protein
MGGAFRRALGSLVTLALLAAAIGFYLASPRLHLTSGSGPVTNAEPAHTQSPTQAASPDPTTTATPTPTRTATQPPGRSPDRNLPPGPGGRQPGIRLTATTTSDGEFDIVETVRLAEPVVRLTLAPPDLRALAGSLKRKQPVAEALKVTAGEHRIKLPNTTVRRATVLTLTRPTDLFELRYRVRGATVASKPSSAGRLLGAVGPLAGVPDELPVAITVQGHSVRNLSCPCLPVDDQACAAGRVPKMRVNQNLARRDSLVLVQFDMTATQVGAPR